MIQIDDVTGAVYRKYLQILKETLICKYLNDQIHIEITN